ncbi:MAG: nucleoside transporter C-terminal domain-containing protein, partial [Candidatus Aenigmatarchaeota archaeon]
MSIYNLISFCGIFVFLFLAWCFSKNKKNINWRLIFWSFTLQVLFAFFIFNLPFGEVIFSWINKAVIKLLSFAKVGMLFVFGPLAISPQEPNSLGFILAFQALPSVIFFSAFMAILYYIGLMPKIIKFFAYIFTRLMNISGAEALYTSSQIVVGIESVFTVRPYIEGMTNSELCTLLTAGMATIASTVMAIYVSFLYNYFPTIAGHLVSASILSAPASIVMAKLLYPEDKIPLTLKKTVKPYYSKASNLIEAVLNASFEGVKLCVGIVALLLAFLGLLSMLNWFVYKIGEILGNFLGISLKLSLEKILSIFYYPFSFFMGIPLKDIPKVSVLLGERTILTELVSYQHLADYIRKGTLTNFRSIVIASYALCGFSHVASLAIFIGGISALV